MATLSMDVPARLLGVICGAVIVLMPFHALLTVWGASLVGHYTALRLWKEVVLVLLIVGVVVLLVQRRSAVRAAFMPREWATRLALVAGAYALVVILSGLIAYLAGGVSPKALVYGLILDLRPVLFFGVAWIVSVYGGGWLYTHWRKLLLIPAMIVVGFGILQFFVLPDDFLSHFGYGPTTISAMQTVDQKELYHRVQSTLRGANPFGAYLILIVSACAAVLIKKLGRGGWKNLLRGSGQDGRSGFRRQVGLYAAAGAASLGALGLTFSRSAWIGACIALGWMAYVALGPGRVRRGLLLAAVAFLIAFSGLTYIMRDNDVFQNAFFHTDEHSASHESSNTGHFNATWENLQDAASRPWGGGAGTAGPASAYNTGKPAKVAENYYIQIAQETGLLGLGLFAALTVMIGRELWLRRRDALALALLASLIGLTATNMFMHSWTDDTIAYIWWGLAGAALLADRSERVMSETEKQGGL